MKKVIQILALIVVISSISVSKANSAMIIPSGIAQEISIAGYQPSEQGFFKAALDGNVATLGLFMEANAFVNIKNETGKTPVYLASSKGKVKAVKFLLLYGADINARDEHLKSPLMAAIEAKSLETCQLLITSGASVKTIDENGYTPLHYAILNNQIEIATIIANQFCDIDATDNEGNTPLFYTVGKEFSDKFIQMLIHSGADINCINIGGKTVLHQAVILNDNKAVKCLIENGANVNMKDEQENTPVFYAKKDSPIYIMLIESGAKI